MAGESFQIIDLTNSGEGHTTVNLGDILIGIVTRYNYSAQCWTMDILDDQGNMILAGLMLVPGVDILDAFQQEKKTLGSIVLIEKVAGDYMSPDLLGINTKLVRFPPGVEAVLQ